MTACDHEWTTDEYGEFCEKCGLRAEYPEDLGVSVSDDMGTEDIFGGR